MVRDWQPLEVDVGGVIGISRYKVAIARNCWWADKGRWPHTSP
jgi:hypothetical protein